MNMRVNARDLLQYTTDELFNNLQGTFTLVMDDGEIQTDWRHTAFSSYAWTLNRRYPEAPFLLKHHVTTTLGNRPLNSETHLKLLTAITWSIYDYLMAADPYNERQHHDLIDDLGRRDYEVVNDIACDLIPRIGAYVVSMSILDLIDIVLHPEVARIHSNTPPVHSEMVKSEKAIMDLIQKSPDFKHNAVRRSMGSKTIKLNQLFQCIGWRGWVHDVDSSIFPQPIMRGFVHGLRSAYDIITESRTAAFAVKMAGADLQDTEYFSRRLQQICQNVQRLHRGDCRSTDYTLARVETADDLIVFNGMNRITDNGLVMINSNDYHLIGQPVKMRTVLHCAHRDVGGVCSTCLGAISDSVPENTNIGQSFSTELMRVLVQTVISTKHVVNSANSEGVLLSEHERRFFTLSEDGNTYFFNSALKKYKSVKVLINNQDAENLTDIYEFSDIKRLSITRVTKLESISFLLESKDGSIEETAVRVAGGKRLSSMTYPLLEHIRKHGWVKTTARSCAVDITEWEWDGKHPVLELPRVQVNMSDHAKEVENAIESRVKDMYVRANHTSPDAFLLEFTELVNSRGLLMNIAITSVIVYAAMIRSVEDHDYRLVKPWTKSGLGVMERTIDRRSLGSAFTYEGHFNNIIDPMSFLLQHRTDHPFDAVFLPEEVKRARYLSNKIKSVAK